MSMPRVVAAVMKVATLEFGGEGMLKDNDVLSISFPLGFQSRNSRNCRNYRL